MPGEGTRPARSGRGWELSPSQAQALLASARTAFFVMVGALVVIWAIQILNFADSYQLDQSYGIHPRDVASLPYILTAPFLHLSWTHIEGNSGPLFIFGFLAAYRGIRKFALVTLIVVITSGLAAWFFEAAGTGVGASGVVFGYFGYIMVRGLFDRRAIDVLIGAVMALCFAYQFSVLIPQPGIGWQAHIGGLVGGIAAGWLLRDRRAARAVTAGPARRAAARAAESGAAAGSAQTAEISPVTTAALAKTTGKPAKGKGKGKGKGFAVDPANPRADLYKQLDDMGL